MTAQGPLLGGVRVLDLAGADAAAITRLLADLGADVLKIALPGDDRDRSAAPLVGTTSVPFALNNANKRCTTLDPADEADRRRFDELVAGADILVAAGGYLTGAFGATCAELADRHPDLVALSVTDFGADGPYRSWVGTDAVFYAMSTALSRSGPATGTPVLPPIGIASATAAAQAAWAVLAAYYHRLRHGGGDYIDFSRFEAVVQALDPPFGSQGQAASGLKRSGGWRGRPRNQQIYPTFPCRDGYVRICLLSARQWRGMRAWLGEPEEFSGPEFDSIAARFAASVQLNAAIAALFGPGTMADLVAQGQSRGVPIAAVQTPAEALASEHFRAVGALAPLPVDGGAVTVPVGPFVVDGAHRGMTAPATEDAAPQWLGPANTLGRPRKSGRRPFDGLRILDLGVIVAGGELGRLFADLGARVVKVESATYPDGLRQTAPGQAMSSSWALTHRNELSFGVDLRRPEGAEIFGRLVGRTDAVFANFKPGTLAALGFSFEALRALNPTVVLAESSAFGDTGPWSDRMGYGPLVRATTGVTRLWRGAGAEKDQLSQFFDATTIFPDHVAARITAIATLAALIRRERTGSGAHVHISQAEVAVNQLAVAYVAEAAAQAGLPLTEDAAVHAVCPCAGDDEWCVISVRDEHDRATLAALIGIDLPADAAALTAILGAYTVSRDKHVLTEELQGAGIPAGPMNRPGDVLDDVQLQFRSLYTDLEHPLFDAPMPSETGPAPFRTIPRGELRPAPVAGEHTRDIAHRALGLDNDEIDRLIADNVLFESDGEPRVPSESTTDQRSAP
ncbi:MAG: CoA transferase [Mycobacterium sp.]|nr:CoA transferase [Mycobacterium sp.]